MARFEWNNIDKNKYMTNITLSIPDEVYVMMKMHKEIRWSEVVRKAITEYIGKLEEKGFEITTEDLLDELDDGYKNTLSELSFVKAAKGYEKMRL